MVTRIIGGVVGGRRIDTPHGRSTRPTSDRVREALFSRLDSRGAVRGAHVVDLYAGSGALGLEAASRGAASVLLVESDPRTAAVARRNAAALALPGVVVRTGTVERVVSGAPDRLVDLVLADPPYDVGEPVLAEVLSRMVHGGWLAPGGVLVVERSARSPEPTWPEGIHPEGAKVYGETALWFADHPSWSR